MNLVVETTRNNQRINGFTAQLIREQQENLLAQRESPLVVPGRDFFELQAFKARCKAAGIRFPNLPEWEEVINPSTHVAKDLEEDPFRRGRSLRIQRFSGRPVGEVEAGLSADFANVDAQLKSHRGQPVILPHGEVVRSEEFSLSA